MAGDNFVLPVQPDELAWMVRERESAQTVDRRCEESVLERNLLDLAVHIAHLELDDLRCDPPVQEARGEIGPAAASGQLDLSSQLRREAAAAEGRGLPIRAGRFEVLAEAASLRRSEPDPELAVRRPALVDEPRLRDNRILLHPRRGALVEPLEILDERLGWLVVEPVDDSLVAVATQRRDGAEETQQKCSRKQYLRPARTAASQARSRDERHQPRSSRVALGLTRFGHSAPRRPNPLELFFRLHLSSLAPAASDACSWDCNLDRSR